MNRLKGRISKIESSGAMSIVSASIADQLSLLAIVIETPQSADYLKVGTPIELLFKETEVIIAKNNSDLISIPNRIPVIVAALQSEKLLTRVTLDSKVGPLISIIPTRSVKHLHLIVGQEVIALVKLNEVMISAR